MARRFDGNRLVIASHNPGKAREIGKLLSSYGIEAISAGSLNLPEPVEDGVTFQANALIKAHAAAKASGLPALADDSGLAIDALGGDPGIHSARWAGPEKDFTVAIEKIEVALKDKANRQACFICVLALCWPDGRAETFYGQVDGTLCRSTRGSGGFGYDPIFIAKGMTKTFAQIDPEHKYAISHRADAFRKLAAACFVK